MKKQPVRMCTACREGRPKKELIRVVKSPDGAVSVDPVGKRSGRGAYICASMECLERARKQRSLARALECEIDDAVYEELEREIESRRADE